MNVRGQLHHAAALHEGKSPPYQLDRRPGGHRSDLDAVAKKRERNLM